jgi:hypothetical protein
VLIIPAIIFIVVVAAVAVGIHAVFSGSLAGIFLGVLFGVVVFAVALLVWISVGGPLSTAVRQYALLFYGGRYQALGDILWPPPPVAGTNVPGMA